MTEKRTTLIREIAESVSDRSVQVEPWIQFYQGNVRIMTNNELSGRDESTDGMGYIRDLMRKALLGRAGIKY